MTENSAAPVERDPDQVPIVDGSGEFPLIRFFFRDGSYHYSCEWCGDIGDEAHGTHLERHAAYRGRLLGGIGA